MPSPNLDVRAARVLLGDLQQLEREIVELTLMRRVDDLERVRDAVRRLGEVGSPEGILDRAAEELGLSSRFGRVLITQVRDGLLIPHGLWIDGAPETAAAALTELRLRPLALEYPLVEAEVVRQQRAEIVSVEASGPRSPARLRELLGWESYLVAALTLRGATIGLLHADAGTDALDASDLEVASVYADGLAGAFERAALRTTLERHREELRAAVSWMNGRLARREAQPAPDSEPDADALTARELQVLRLLSSGQTNSGIARELVISESTAKFHVKNILRKLQATSRADAVAKYMRRGA